VAIDARTRHSKRERGNLQVFASKLLKKYKFGPATAMPARCCGVMRANPLLLRL
jgi:hypothetical protein